MCDVESREPPVPTLVLFWGGGAHVCLIQCQTAREVYIGAAVELNLNSDDLPLTTDTDLAVALGPSTTL